MTDKIPPRPEDDPNVSTTVYFRQCKDHEHAVAKALYETLERAGRCLVMNNNGAREAVDILREAKRLVDESGWEP